MLGCGDGEDCGGTAADGADVEMLEDETRARGDALYERGWR